MGLLHALSLWSPGLLLVAVVVALNTRSESGPKPSVLVSCVCAVLVGCFGAFVIERIQPGGWGIQYLFFPFLWCKWALIGFCGSWFLAGFVNGNPRLRTAGRWLFGVAAVALLVLTIAGHGYVPAVYQADREFWQQVFFKRISNLPLEEYRKHLSKEGREAVSHQLQYDKQTAAELLPILAQVLGGAGGLADQTTITRSLVEQILQEASVARNRYEPGSPASDAGLTTLAENPATPTDILEKLASDPSQYVRTRIALNKAAPPSVLEKLVNEERPNDVSDSSVGALARATLAEHRQTAGARLVELAHDPVARVRAAAAQNLNAPLELLVELTQDADAKVQRNAWSTMGRSPSTPAAKLEELAESPDRDAWAAVAGNPNTPLALVSKLLRRDDYATRMSASRNLAVGDENAREILRRAIRDFDHFDSRGLSRERRLPKWVYIELTQVENEARQRAFEQLSNLDDVTESELRDLLSKADESTLKHLADSSRCSPLLLRILAKSPVAEIQMKAQKTLDYVTEHGVQDK